MTAVLNAMTPINRSRASTTAVLGPHPTARPTTTPICWPRLCAKLRPCTHEGHEGKPSMASLLCGKAKSPGGSEKIFSKIFDVCCCCCCCCCCRASLPANARCTQARFVPLPRVSQCRATLCTLGSAPLSGTSRAYCGRAYRHRLELPCFLRVALLLLVPLPLRLLMPRALFPLPLPCCTCVCDAGGQFEDGKAVEKTKEVRDDIFG
eukprot:SAG11_NODE_12263_length_712_cov_1.168026_1_plen_206_part_01